MQESKDDNRQGGLSWSTPAQSTMPVQKPIIIPKAQVMPPPPSSNSTKYIGMIVLGIIAGVIIAWGWSALRAQKEPVSVTAGTDLGADASATPTLVSGLGITIASPQAAGNSVAIAKISVSSPTWIVIYENNAGQPGNALGAGLFSPESTAGTVELLRGTSADKSYLATLQVDNGDHKFSLKDDQFLSTDGAPQWVTFEVK